MLSQNIGNIREHPNKEIRKFFRRSFDEMQGIGSQIFHLFLPPMLDKYFSDRFNLSWDDVLDRHCAIILIQELFVPTILAQNFGIEPILSLSDIELREIIFSLPPIPIDHGEAIRQLVSQDIDIDLGPVLLQRYTDAFTVQDMLQHSPQSKRMKTASLVAEWGVPDFSKIPIQEIANLKTKGKLAPLEQFIVEMTHKYAHLQDIDFAKMFVEHLWQIGETLSPSISEVAIGVLSEVPIPLPVNPIGIVSALNEIHQFITFQREYKWFIALKSLRAKAS